MKLNTHLSFNGECEAAFKFYETALGGKISTLMKYAGTPVEEHVPVEWRDKIIHATLQLDDAVLTGADAAPGNDAGYKGFSVLLQLKDPADAERIFHVLAEGGTVTMPLQQTFWTVSFGMLVDRFGVPWMINCEQPT